MSSRFRTGDSSIAVWAQTAFSKFCANCIRCSIRRECVISPRSARTRPSPRWGGDRERQTNESAISRERDHGRNSNGKIGNIPAPRAGALMTIEPKFPFVTALKATPPAGIGH